MFIVRRHYELVSKYDTGLKSLLLQVLSEPEFHGDLVYTFKDIVGKPEFSDQFRKIVICYKRKGYNINVIKQSACLAGDQITVDHFLTSFIARRCVGIQTVRLPRLENYSLDALGQNFLCLFLGPLGFNW